MKKPWNWWQSTTPAQLWTSLDGPKKRADLEQELEKSYAQGFAIGLPVAIIILVVIWLVAR